MEESHKSTDVITGGLAPRADGRPVDLTLEPGAGPLTLAAAPSISAPVLPVAAVLLDQAGAPLAGRRVRFTLQGSAVHGFQMPGTETMCFVNSPSGCWAGLWTVDAVTGSDGRAVVGLPLAEPDERWFLARPNLEHVRVTASFDGVAGSPGLYPAHRSSPPIAIDGPAG